MTALGILSVAHPHAASYAPALAANPDIQFTGIADDQSERAASFADEHGTSVHEPEALLETSDGVVVCGENATHHKWVEMAAVAGVDVLCEKPLATSTADAERMLETADENGVALGVAMPLRFSRPVQEAETLLSDGTLGDLLSIVGTNRGRMPGLWFPDPDLAGGGAAMDHTVHIVDLVHWLTGERVVEVYAELATRMHDIQTEDVNVLSMELAGGATFSLDGSWSRPDEWPFWGDATLELVGTEGVVSVNCFDQTVQRTIRSGANAGRADLYWGDDLDARLLADFASAVSMGDQPLVSGREGRDAVAVVEAVYESAERQEPVAVTY